MTGLSLGDNMTLHCECGGSILHIQDDDVECTKCGKPLDEGIYWELTLLGKLHYIGLNPEDIRGIRCTQSNSEEYEPRLILTMKNGEKLTLCKVLKEAHLQ